MRLFIAIELPGKTKEALGRLKSDITGARWVPVNQIHLTLAFLGEVRTETVSALVRELSKIQVQSFRLTFTGTGCFPGPRKARVLWVGVHPEPRLDTLAAEVFGVVASCALPREDRAFSPHVTLARLKAPAPPEVLSAFLQHPLIELGPMPVKEFVLFESRLSSAGAIHTPVETFKLLES